MVQPTRSGAHGVHATPDLINQARRRVRHLEATGLSRREVARRATVSHSSVAKLMGSDPRISKTTARRLATVT